jgi:hypothetical protein
MPRKMARQTLERHAGASYAGSRPYLGSGLLGSPENRYNLPHFRVHPGNPGLRSRSRLPHSNVVNVGRPVPRNTLSVDHDRVKNEHPGGGGDRT